MRDIAFMLVFIPLWLSCFVRPYLGPLVWAWVSMMYPHRLAYGFVHNFPAAYVVAVTTLLVFVVTREKYPFPRNGPAVLLVVFFGWACVSSLASFNDPDMVFDLWLKVAKIQLMLFVTMMMLSGRRQIIWLVAVIALSVGFYGFKGGIFTLLTQGRGNVLGPPGSFIEPNNELGVALVTVFPLLYFLYGISRNKWLRWGLLATALLTLAAIFGTYSRAAVLAVAAMAVFMGFKSNHKVLTVTVLAVALAGTVALLPERWMERMQSISTHQDESSQSRFKVWTLIGRIAMDHPLTGGGYRITENPKTWEKYGSDDSTVAYAPHSIYFQVLAEHGFVGLFLFLVIGVATWRLASRVARQARDGPDADWAPQLMGMIQVSLIGYGVAGGFNALANYDVPYYLAAIVAMVARDLKVGRAPMIEAKAGAAVNLSR
ncbi:MAG: wzy family polymerase, exosortase system type 1 associated [Rhodocyclaceae bacterium]|nr:wzy family polymerase, exosortase system type 1 associated [Rhodocyclaceae bacterium]